MESLISINRQLKDLYGSDIVTGKAIWRVVWSEDQTEKRLSKFTPSGIELLHPKLQEFPKYSNFFKDRYILEKLSLVPENHEELTVDKISYEPIYKFEEVKNDGTVGKIQPSLQACKFIIDLIYAATGKSSLAKYKDPGDPPEVREQRINALQQELFGNETPTGDALAHGYGTTVPSNYEKVN